MIARVLDIGTDPDDEPDLRIRKRTAVASALAFMATYVMDPGTPQGRAHLPADR